MAFSTKDISLDVLVCRHGGMDNKFAMASLSSHLDVAFHTRLMRESQGFTAFYEAVDRKFTGDTFNRFYYYFHHHHFLSLISLLSLGKWGNQGSFSLLLPWVSCSTLILPKIRINVLHTVFSTFPNQNLLYNYWELLWMDFCFILMTSLFDSAMILWRESERLLNLGIESSSHEMTLTGAPLDSA